MTSRRASGEAAPERSGVREAFVAEAIRILDEEGVGALNLRRLAARVGVKQPALYRHFESKEALLGEIASRGMRAFGEAMAEALASSDDPYDALAAVARSYVRFAARNPGWFRLYFSRGAAEGQGREAAGASDVPGQEAAGESDRPGREAADATASRDAVLGALARIVPHESPGFGHTYRVLWALSHGLASFVTERVFRLVPDDDARIAAADAAIDELIGLLRARWGEPRRPAPLPPDIERVLTRGLGGASPHPN